jgi:hypothetical protein
VLACKRQQREHRAALEPLVRDVLVRPLAAEVGDERALAVIPVARRDSRLLAHERVRSIGADHELCAEGFSIGKNQACPVIPGIQAGALRRREDVDLEVAPQRALQQPVLDDPGELRHARAVGIELQTR